MSLLRSEARVWRQGQTTNAFVCPKVSIPTSSRFKLYSIYWPQKNVQAAHVKRTQTPLDREAAKISRQIDEEQKNQSRMGKLSLSVNRKGGSSSPRRNRNSGVNFRPATSDNLSSDNQKTILRLSFTSGFRQSRLRDRHGNRSNLLENEQDEFLTKIKDNEQMKGIQKGFFTSRRINLNLPHNYYPGPGSYQIQRYLEGKSQSPRKNPIKYQSSRG